MLAGSHQRRCRRGCTHTRLRSTLFCAQVRCDSAHSSATWSAQPGPVITPNRKQCATVSTCSLIAIRAATPRIPPVVTGHKRAICEQKRSIHCPRCVFIRLASSSALPAASAATSAAARVIEDSWSEHGWSITSRKGPISGQAVLQGITSRLDSPPSLPEMVYGDNSLVLRHEASGLQLKFDAESALREWLREGQEPLQLMHADKWKEARTHEIQMTNAAVVSYDWCACQPFPADVCDVAASEMSRVTCTLVVIRKYLPAGVPWVNRTVISHEP